MGPFHGKGVSGMFCLLGTTAERAAAIYPLLVNKSKHRSDGETLRFPLVRELPNGVGPARADRSMFTRGKPGPMSAQKNGNIRNTSFF